jgi:hypothetical protein
VATLAMSRLGITADGAVNVGGSLAPQQWHTLRFTWKSAAAGAACEIALDDQSLGSLPIRRTANHGISYLHFQSTSERPDQGLVIESVRAGTDAR